MNIKLSTRFTSPDKKNRQQQNRKVNIQTEFNQNDSKTIWFVSISILRFCESFFPPNSSAFWTTKLLAISLTLEGEKHKSLLHKTKLCSRTFLFFCSNIWLWILILKSSGTDRMKRKNAAIEAQIMATVANDPGAIVLLLFWMVKKNSHTAKHENRELNSRLY